MFSFDKDRDGVITDAEVERFRVKASELVESLANGVLNYSVVFSLLFTIFVSLSVLQSGEAPYSASVLAPLREAEGEMFNAAAGDTADWLCSRSSPLCALNMRWYAYVLEWVLLAAGTTSVSIGIYFGIFLYGMLTANMPNTLAKCELIVRKPSRLGILGNCFFMSLLCLLFALAAILVRASAVAFLCGCAPPVALLTYHLSSSACGDMFFYLKQLQSEARLLLPPRANLATATGDLMSCGT